MQSLLRGLAAIFLLSMLVSGCGGGATSPEETTTTAPAGSPSPGMASPAVEVNREQVVVQLNPMNNAGVAGTATLRPEDNETTVDIVLMPASPTAAASPIASPPSEASYPAGIYQGTCAQYSPTPAYPLEPATYGGPTPGSRSTINADLTRLVNQDFAIVIQRSQSDATPISCGFIRTSGVSVSPGPNPFS